MKATIAAILGLFILAGSASAVVIVSGTTSGLLDTTDLSGDFVYNLQGDGNTIVFGTYIDQVYTASNILFGGNAPDGTIQNGRSFLAYYYNPDPSTSITFDIDLAPTSDLSSGYFLYELDFVDTGVAANLGMGDSITTTGADRFVVDYMGVNFSNGAGASPAVGSIVSSFNILDVNGDGGGGALATGTGFAGAAGPQTLGWIGASFTGDVSAAFAAAAGGPTPWNLNGGGSWNLGANWLGGSVPANNPFFGTAHATATTANITLDSPVSVGSITISNANPYNITGPSALTLTGSAEVLVGDGTHEVSAVIAGSAGLTKTGGGNLVLSGANSYSGTTNVQGGALQLSVPGTVPGAVSVASGTQLAFVPGYNGAFANAISGAGGVTLDASLTTETVTFSSAKTYSGATAVLGGTLAISNAGALGAGDSTPAAGTTVSANGSLGNAKLALSGGINVANELLTLFPRRGEGVVDLVHVTSAGNNTWGGNIVGGVNGDNYNFESTSGTLTLGGTLSAPDGDTGVRNFVFSGPGNFDVTRISDFGADANGVIGAGSLNTEANVVVTKRGAGNLTIRTSTANQDDFWQGGTVVEGGTLEVIASGTAGELWGPLEIQSGTTFDVDSFTTYALSEGTSIAGAGIIEANTFKIFADNSLSPGDSVGTLTINGNAQLSDEFGSAGGVLAFELGSDPLIVGGAENDLILVNGSLTTIGSPDMTVSVTAAEGAVSAGQYRLISHSGGAVNVSGLTAQFLDETGNALTARQTLAVSSAADQVNLDVTGSSKNLTWTGAVDMAWDKNATANWNDGGGADVFFDVDQVTFNDSAGENDTVDISGGDVYPALVTFNSATGNTYTVTGANGFGGTTPINLTGDVTAVFANNNNLQGTINIGSNATLNIGQGGGASTIAGDITGDGTLVIGGGFVPMTSALAFTGPIIINGGTATISNDAALGASSAGTTITAGALNFNFVNVTTNEPLTFNGGQVQTNASTVVLTGGINTTAAGGAFTLNGGQGDEAMLISGNIAGSASGPISTSIGAGTTMRVTGNITNNGNLILNGEGALAIGAATTVAAAEIAVNAGTFDVSAKGQHTLVSGQTLTGADGAVLGNVAAASGSTIRVGDAGLPQRTFAEYVDATYNAGGNTTFVNGGTLTPPAGVFSGNNEWSERTGFANGGTVLQGAVVTPPDTASVPVIRTTVTGLDPGQTYDVYANFWDVDDAIWPVFAGDSDTNLTLYANPNDGLEGATDAVDPNTLSYSTPVLLSESNRTMWGALIGTLTADGSGNIEVFIDDTGNGPNQRTWYDGVTVSSGITSAVGETFTIDGNLTLQAGSTLALDIGTPDQSDLLSITGDLFAGGTLAVALDLTVPVPTEGTVFDILDFASAGGMFSSLSLPSLGSGLGWNTSSLLTTGELSVIAVAGMPGDFNEDGIVNAADYVVWRNNLDGGAALPNDNGLGTPISTAHYDLWKMNYGAGLGSGAAVSGSAQVPEPSSVALLAAALFSLGFRRRRAFRAPTCGVAD
jgi:autotransporter-associated beta strand protein